MTQVLTITQLGNPILQQKAPEIDNLLDSDCQNLIDSLITTVQAATGWESPHPKLLRLCVCLSLLLVPILVIPTLR
ncbi:hypothetical protein MICAE_1520050 [Microcystis aeruginosa PCC 9806]|uniref:Peptide deformylase n=1 Tax=Microcystis aeruginosa PCC 9806 TaxID=1160282 RepID=I4GSQ6_MICAE|nr:hypothetical protein MICAE_1520050 [Microcystis aeruginosa PCC 9806]